MSGITWWRMLGSIVVCLLAAAAHAQDAASMARAGYPPDSYTVLMTWNEQAPQQPDAQVVGIRIQPTDGSAPQDVYFLQGQPLSSESRRAMGIPDKPWERGPREASLSRPPKSAAALPTVPVPVGVALNLAPKSVLGVPAPDVTALLAEDEAQRAEGKGSNRTGVFQALPEDIAFVSGQPSAGAWTATPDGGQLWSVELTAPGAVGLRVHFDALAVPTGGGLMVYNPDRPTEAFGPYNSIDPRDASLWTPTTYGERVVLECYLPAGYTTDLVTLHVAEVAYVYLNPLRYAKIAGFCNLDSTCEPAWADTALAVCGLGVVGQSGTLFCTGTLMADNDSCTDVNYLLTANHCVSGPFGARGASSLEFYWEYQTAVCDSGAPPNPATVPRTIGGADYLAGAGGRGDSGGGNDFSFMRLRNAPPSNIPSAGWTTNVPAQGAELTCIHHPRGDYKRISFGNKTNTANAFPALYHEVTWHDGTTEPGSSGSPLFRSDTQQIIGQLWGGGASCAEPDAPDYYGRFDVTYPVIAAYLDPVPAMISITQAAASLVESDGSTEIMVSLSAPSGGSVTVDYTIIPGTAQSGTHFTAGLSGTLQFAMGEDEQPIPITVVDDTHLNAARSFTITLSNAVCSQVETADVTTTVTIADDEADSDGDSVSDADEIGGFYGPPTNPNLSDTDGDGLSDAQELFNVFGYDTDPTLADTDGDGIPDYNEILLGLDPTDSFDASALSSLTVPYFETR